MGGTDEHEKRKKKRKLRIKNGVKETGTVNTRVTRDNRKERKKCGRQDMKTRHEKGERKGALRTVVKR